MTTTQWDTTPGGIMVPKPNPPTEEGPDQLVWHRRDGIAPIAPVVKQRMVMPPNFPCARVAFYEGRRWARMERNERTATPDDMVLFAFAEAIHAKAYETGRGWVP